MSDAELEKQPSTLTASCFAALNFAHPLSSWSLHLHLFSNTYMRLSILEHVKTKRLLDRYIARCCKVLHWISPQYTTPGWTSSPMFSPSKSGWIIIAYEHKAMHPYQSNFSMAEPKPFWWQTGQRCNSWQLRLLRGQVGDPLGWFGADTDFSSDFWVSAIQGSRTVHLLAFGHLGKRRLWTQRACTNPKWLLKSCVDVETWHLMAQ